MSNDLLITLPVLIPFITAIIGIFAWNKRRLQETVSFVGSVLGFFAAIGLILRVIDVGPIALQLGNWPAPFGITYVADLFSAIMVMIVGILSLAVSLYSLADIDKYRESLGYHVLYHTLIMGVNGAFITGDMFNMYVWFEIMLISSFVLLALGGERQQIQGAIKYVTINLVSSAIFLAGLGILYGVTGTLNMADLHFRMATVPTGMATTLSMVFLTAFGIKGALFPLFSWLPASYHTPPTAIAAIFAGLLSKVGVYAIIRVFTLIFVQDQAYTSNILLILAGLTMLSGVFGAVSQKSIRRILSFHITSQIGYMIMGLGVATMVGVSKEVRLLAMTGAIFYIIHHIIVKANLFLISGVVEWIGGTDKLKKLGGFYEKMPFLSVLFLISALSLAGIPPLSGFWAKFTIIRAGVEAQSWGIVATSLVVGLLTLFSMTKIWAAVFWGKQPEKLQHDLPEIDTQWVLRFAPIIMLAGCTILIGLNAESFYQIASTASEQLLDPTGYLEAVGITE